jgi:hypothetical protein
LSATPAYAHDGWKLDEPLHYAANAPIVQPAPEWFRAVPWSPMRRRLFTLAAGVSVVLCVGVCVLWIKSYQEGFRATYVQDGERRRVWLFRGQVGQDNVPEMRIWAEWMADESRRLERAVDHLASVPHALGTNRDVVGQVTADAQEARREFDAAYGAFSAVHQAPPSSWSRSTRLAIPVATGLLAIAPVAAIFQRMRRWRRTAQPRCLICGYDLRATPGRCPECGAVPAAKGAT